MVLWVPVPLSDVLEVIALYESLNYTFVCLLASLSIAFTLFFKEFKIFYIKASGNTPIYTICA
ncbi:hypothetical protein SCEN_M00290 [Saccharomyces cerevisiae]|nr:hypothetical protein SCEN_M00290 [Saccharomyces cerevisiae]